MRIDRESDWPTRLLETIREAPVVDKIPHVGGVQKMSRMRSGDEPVVLPISERRVLEACSRGLTYEMAGDMLGISPTTVKEYLKTARYRLRAKNTTHACCEALRLGLIR